MPKKSPSKAVVVATFTLGIIAACSEDTTAPPPLPEGPPELRILSIDAPGMHTAIDDAGAGGCFPVGEGSTEACDSAVSGPGCGFVVVLKTNGSRQIPLALPDGSQPRFWTFEPPFGCNGAPDCGYALLLIDPATDPCDPRPAAAVKTFAAGPVISVDFAELQKGLHGAFGKKKVRVELWPGEGFPSGEHYCRAHSREVDVDFELSCGSRASEGGTTDASTDAPVSDSGSNDAASEASATSDASDASNDAFASDAAHNDATDGSDSG